MKKLVKDPLNLIITGVGGQGNVLMAYLVGQALMQKGYNVSVSDTYGASQRGGSVASHVKISSKEHQSPLIPKGDADIILSLEPLEALRLATQLGHPDTLIITNSRPVYPSSVASGEAEYPDMNELFDMIRNLSSKTWIVDATREALDMGNRILSNSIMIGNLLGADLIPVDRESMIKVFEAQFQGPILDSNIKAIDKGIELID